MGGAVGFWEVALLLMVAEYILTEYYSRDALQSWIENGLFGDNCSIDIDSYSPEKINIFIDETRIHYKKAYVNYLQVKNNNVGNQ